MIPRRSWFKLSLRTSLLAITLFSVLFAWQFYYRAAQVRECDRIRSLFANSASHCNIYYDLFGWRIPEKATWLQPIAYPRPMTIRIRASQDQTLPEEYCAVARRCVELEYEGNDGGDDEFLRKCTSAKTQILKLSRNGVPPGCLAFVHECPNLREVDADYVNLSAESFTALLTHPKIEKLNITEYDAELRKLPALKAASALRQLEVALSHEWTFETGASANVPGGPPSPFGSPFDRAPTKDRELNNFPIFQLGCGSMR